jgi:hypothetical protein
VAQVHGAPVRNLYGTGATAPLHQASVTAVPAVPRLPEAAALCGAAASVCSGVLGEPRNAAPLTLKQFPMRDTSLEPASGSLPKTPTRSGGDTSTTNVDFRPIYHMGRSKTASGGCVSLTHCCSTRPFAACRLIIYKQAAANSWLPGCVQMTWR